MNLDDYLKLFLTDVQHQKDALFTNEIRLSRTYANMNGNVNVLNEEEKRFVVLNEEFNNTCFFLQSKQYRDDVNLANEKITHIKNVFEEISDLFQKIEWR